MSPSHSSTVACRTSSSSDRRIVRTIGALMVVVAVSLAVAATVHLSGQVHGRAKSFDADGAGVAEAIIGIVVAVGALAVLRRSSKARTIVLTTTCFAIIGFAGGLTFTTQGGAWPDIAYHLTVLPILIASLIVLVRVDPSAFRPDTSPKDRDQVRA
ncbi:MAG TPA: hypothetical protein VGG09_06070 [Acidimicrobiales bacterium]|jgi:hypothetical protein